MRTLILAAVCTLSAPAFAFGVGSTGDTGSENPGSEETETPTGTGGTLVLTADTGGGLCLDCRSAAELAGETGGSPCNSCSHAPGGAATTLIALWFATRRRRSSAA